jgi:hypothetical protein
METALEIEVGLAFRPIEVIIVVSSVMNFLSHIIFLLILEVRELLH